MLCAYITMRQSFLYFAEHCPFHLQLNIDQLLSSILLNLKQFIVMNYTTFCTVFTTSIISNLIKIYSFLKYCIYHKYKFCTFLQWLSGLFYLKFFNSSFQQNIFAIYNKSEENFSGHLNQVFYVHVHPASFSTIVLRHISSFVLYS